MADNWDDTEIEKVTNDQIAERKKIGIPKFVNIRDLAKEKLQANPNDPDASAALEILQKGLAAFLQEHGATGGPRTPAMLGNGNDADENGEYGPLCRQHKGKMLVPELDADGNPVPGSMLYEDVAIANRYSPVFDSSSPDVLIGYRNPSTRSPVNTQDPNEMLPITDAAGVTTQIKFSEGEKLVTNGTHLSIKNGDKVVAFTVKTAPPKGGLIRRRKSKTPVAAH
jgi:hypothetical protein